MALEGLRRELACRSSWRLYKQKQKWDAGGRTQSFLPLLQTLAKLCQNGSTQHFHHSMYIMSPLAAQITTLVITTQTAHLQDEIRKCGHQTVVKISCLLGSSVPSPVETVGPLPQALQQSTFGWLVRFLRLVDEIRAHQST